MALPSLLFARIQDAYDSSSALPQLRLSRSVSTQGAKSGFLREGHGFDRRQPHDGVGKTMVSESAGVQSLTSDIRLVTPPVCRLCAPPTGIVYESPPSTTGRAPHWSMASLLQTSTRPLSAGALLDGNAPGPRSSLPWPGERRVSSVRVALGRTPYIRPRPRLNLSDNRLTKSERARPTIHIVSLVTL